MSLDTAKLLEKQIADIETAQRDMNDPTERYKKNSRKVLNRKL